MAQCIVMIIFRIPIGRMYQHTQSTSITALKMRSMKAISMMIHLQPFGSLWTLPEPISLRRAIDILCKLRFRPRAEPSGLVSPFRQAGPRARRRSRSGAREGDRASGQGPAGGTCSYPAQAWGDFGLGWRGRRLEANNFESSHLPSLIHSQLHISNQRFLSREHRNIKQ